MSQKSASADFDPNQSAALGAGGFEVLEKVYRYLEAYSGMSDAEVSPMALQLEGHWG